MPGNILPVYKKVRYLIVFLYIIALSGCNFFISLGEVEILLPQVLPEILNDTEFFWILSLPDDDGLIKKVEFTSDLKSIVITVEKGVIFPVSLNAVIKLNNGALFPISSAGYIYPYSEKFDWLSGFESDLLLKLTEYMDINRLNYYKLSNAINDISEGNPWTLDGEHLVENLLSGNFRIYDIRKKRKRTIEITIPEGIWYRENIYDDSIISLAGNIPIEQELYVGFNRFFNKNGIL